MMLALGSNIFSILPLNLQKLTQDTKANWPGTARFGGSVKRQFTGMGEHSIRIEGLVFPAHFGGFARYNAIRAVQAAGEAVPMIGLATGFVGLVYGNVAILSVSDTQEYFDKISGIGKKLAFTVEVSPTGDGLYGALWDEHIFSKHARPKSHYPHSDGGGGGHRA